jgi:hypothetical protein
MNADNADDGPFALSALIGVHRRPIMLLKGISSQPGSLTATALVDRISFI